MDDEKIPRFVNLDELLASKAVKLPTRQGYDVPIWMSKKGLAKIK